MNDSMIICDFDLNCFKVKKSDQLLMRKQGDADFSLSQVNLQLKFIFHIMTGEINIVHR